ncbi:MAG: hypothetical protein LPH19_15365, partial [Shewanella sp.]|nr:hypothetical protein [Shewanella sp.]
RAVSLALWGFWANTMAVVLRFERQPSLLHLNILNSNLPVSQSGARTCLHLPYRRLGATLPAAFDAMISGNLPNLALTHCYFENKPNY